MCQPLIKTSFLGEWLSYFQDRLTIVCLKISTPAVHSSLLHRSEIVSYLLLSLGNYYVGLQETWQLWVCLVTLMNSSVSISLGSHICGSISLPAHSSHSAMHMHACICMYANMYVCIHVCGCLYVFIFFKRHNLPSVLTGSECTWRKNTLYCLNFFCVKVIKSHQTLKLAIIECIMKLNI